MTVASLLSQTPYFWRFAKCFTSAEPDKQWLRVVMNERTKALIQRHVPASARVLEVSGDSWRGFEGFGEYRCVFYPEYDVCEAPLEEHFDLVIAEQVFEHLAWPYKAGRNVFNMLRPGGFFLITTPFLLRIHEHPLDCTRWSATGIRYFLAECGFSLDKVQSDSWGNRACVRGNFRRWLPYVRAYHSLANEPSFPISVWALAQK